MTSPSSHECSPGAPGSSPALREGGALPSLPSTRGASSTADTGQEDQGGGQRPPQRVSATVSALQAVLKARANIMVSLRLNSLSYAECWEVLASRLAELEQSTPITGSLRQLRPFMVEGTAISLLMIEQADREQGREE